MAETKFDVSGLMKMCARGGTCRIEGEVVLACTGLSTTDTVFTENGRKRFLGPGFCLKGIGRKQFRKSKIKILPKCEFESKV
jgi:hypothetical protein